MGFEGSLRGVDKRTGFARATREPRRGCELRFRSLPIEAAAGNGPEEWLTVLLGA